MPSRLTCACIIVFWLVMMSWLVRRDVLPEWHGGDPPGFGQVVSSLREREPTFWTVSVAGRRVGWAGTTCCRQKNGSMLVVSRTELGGLIQVFSAGHGDARDRDLGLSGLASISPAGNLRYFQVEADLLGQGGVVKISGRVEDGILSVFVHATGLSISREFHYPENSLMQAPMMPLARLPGLHVGQQWRERVPDPFLKDVQTVRRRVVRDEMIVWHGQPVRARVVQTTDAQDRVVGTTWVADTGDVLRHRARGLLTTIVMERWPARKPCPYADRFQVVFDKVVEPLR